MQPKILPAGVALLLGLPAWAQVLPNPYHPVQLPPRAQAAAALQGDDPVARMRHLAKLPQSQLLAEGMRLEACEGEGRRERIRIRFLRPLELHGARAAFIALDFERPQPNFRGQVFAEFEGDLEAFARAAELRLGHGPAPFGGTWLRIAAPRAGEDAVALHAAASGPGRFLFGCRVRAIPD